MTTGDLLPDRSLVGAVLTRAFRLTHKLGDGGMGEVYAAEVIAGTSPAAEGGQAGQRVAVKILHQEFLGDPIVLERFLEEARTCQRLVHPNIVRVFESRTAEDGSPFFVMELLDGVPLSAYTQNGGRVPIAQAVPILQGILAGLSAAHAQGVVHRDLKPDNVFLTRDGAGSFVVKIVDFGIAKVMDVAGGMGTKTRTGMLLGTPAYMSPEQIKNAKDVDARADLWSAGVMLYEMLTGRVAFPAPTEYARLTAVLSTVPEPLASVDASLAPLAAVVERALQKDRALRFQSAPEMSRAVAATAVMPRDGEAHPLSRLPDVPSLFAPSITISAMLPTAPAAPLAITPASLARPMGKTPGGTLTSPAAPPISEVSPRVLLVATPAASGETLPSKDLPVFPAKTGAQRPPSGVAFITVVLLVIAALVAGSLIGFAVARLM